MKTFNTSGELKSPLFDSKELNRRVVNEETKYLNITPDFNNSEYYKIRCHFLGYLKSIEFVVDMTTKGYRLTELTKPLKKGFQVVLSKPDQVRDEDLKKIANIALDNYQKELLLRKEAWLEQEVRKEMERIVDEENTNKEVKKTTAEKKYRALLLKGLEAENGTDKS